MWRTRQQSTSCRPELDTRPYAAGRDGLIARAAPEDTRGEPAETQTVKSLVAGAAQPLRRVLEALRFGERLFTSVASPA